MTLREIDALIAEKLFGWRWIQAPQWDYDGPLPEQGKVLVPPVFDERDYQWPPKGVVHSFFFLPLHGYSSDPVASKVLRNKLAEKWDWILANGKTRPYEPRFGFALYRMNTVDAVSTFAAETDESEELAIALCALKSVGIEVEVTQ